MSNQYDPDDYHDLPLAAVADPAPPTQKQPPLRAVTPVYMICDAYESGVGKGLHGFTGKNPYGTGGDPVNAQCHEAWDIGREKGEEIRRDQEKSAVNEVKVKTP